MGICEGGCDSGEDEEVHNPESLGMPGWLRALCKREKTDESMRVKLTM